MNCKCVILVKDPSRSQSDIVSIGLSERTNYYIAFLRDCARRRITSSSATTAATKNSNRTTHKKEPKSVYAMARFEGGVGRNRLLLCFCYCCNGNQSSMKSVENMYGGIIPFLIFYFLFLTSSIVFSHCIIQLQCICPACNKHISVQIRKCIDSITQYNELFGRESIKCIATETENLKIDMNLL